MMYSESTLESMGPADMFANVGGRDSAREHVHT
jgi:hypothetical protein